MIPDTSSYMVAGFLVIFLGIIAYLASLIIRTIAMHKKINKFSSKRMIDTK